MHVSQEAPHIFTDFNGVLDDIERVRQRLWVKAMKEHHRNEDPSRLLDLVNLKEEHFAVTLGRLPEDYMPRLESQFILSCDVRFAPNMEAVKELRDKLLKEIVGSDYAGWPKKPGFDEFIDLVREPGCPKPFIVTSQERGLTCAILSAWGVPSDTFEIVSRENVNCNKPNPEGYLFAMDQANTERGVALEDSEVGLQAIRAVSAYDNSASLMAIQVDPMYGVSRLAHYSVSDLAGVTQGIRNGDFQ
jgi:beta-phosphoglucomutase-like phosphatase (HAD superfamily)